MTHSKKIIHIITSLGIGGAELMLKRLLYSDPNSKNEALIISLSGFGKIGEALELSGYQVHALNFNRVSSLCSNFWSLVQLIKANKPVLVQTWMYHADFFGGLAAKIAGCSNIVWGIRTTHIPSNNKRTYYLMRLCAFLSYLIPKRIICVAEAAKKTHISHGYHAKKMRVIPNGFDFERFDALHVKGKRLRQELGLTDSDFVIGCVGRYHLDKGQDVLINAVSLLEKSCLQGLRFILVGRGCDGYNELLRNQIQSLGLRNSFILLGERQDIPQCLAAMDIFCMPSRTEGFPNGLGEAMSLALPCVATHVGDVKILAGDTVLLVPPNDPLALAQGLTNMICMQSQERQRLGSEAAQRVRKYFCMNKAQERFYEVYREITELSY